MCKRSTSVIYTHFQKYVVGKANSYANRHANSHVDMKKVNQMYKQKICPDL